MAAMAANTMDGDRQACLDMGMDDYIGDFLSARAKNRVATCRHSILGKIMCQSFMMLLIP